METRDSFIVRGLLTLLAFILAGSVVHISPRFPGSLAGGLVGIASALLLLLLLVYSLARRNSAARAWMTKFVSLQKILSFHIYAGIVAALLAILHSGHNYASMLGIALVTAMLMAVFSGFAGHYFLVQLGSDIRGQQAALAVLRHDYDATIPNFASRDGPSGPEAGHTVQKTVEAIADLEFSIGGRELLKRSLRGWTILHIGSSLLMYVLLLLHIWSEIYYGLRWIS